MLSEFEPVARKDRQRLRKKAVLDPIEVTYEKWRVLQIDSHNNQLGTLRSKPTSLMPSSAFRFRKLGSTGERSFSSIGCSWDIYSVPVFIYERLHIRALTCT